MRDRLDGLLSDGLTGVTLAQAPGGSASAVPPMFPMVIIMILVFYFIVLRPEMKKNKERNKMLTELKKNDHVLTSGGIYGVVVSVKDNEVMLKVEETSNLKLRLAKSAIVEVLQEGDAKGEKSG